MPGPDSIVIEYSMYDGAGDASVPIRHSSQGFFGRWASAGSLVTSTFVVLLTSVFLLAVVGLDGENFRSWPRFLKISMPTITYMRTVTTTTSLLYVSEFLIYEGAY
jgi:hypothetical protein